MTLIAPSLLPIWDKSPGNLRAMVEAAVAVEAAGADWLHLDVMDGRFVPAVTFGPNYAKALKDNLKIPLDVHLMVHHPEDVIEEYLEAGADRVTFHPSASQDVLGCLQVIQKAGKIAGLALDVPEEIAWIDKYPTLIQQVTVLTVKAGKGGQGLIPSMLDKIRTLKATYGAGLTLVADGGVNQQTIDIVHKSGADVAVAGRAIFSRENYAQALALLHPLA